MDPCRKHLVWRLNRWQQCHNQLSYILIRIFPEFLYVPCTVPNKVTNNHISICISNLWDSVSKSIKDIQWPYYESKRICISHHLPSNRYLSKSDFYFFECLQAVMSLISHPPLNIYIYISNPYIIRFSYFLLITFDI
jgi:hypothetical protein